LTIERFSSGGPLEERIGYSRAVRAGELVFVSGCTALAEEGYVVGGASVYEQAREALHRLEGALAQARARPADVVQTRIYLTDVERWEEVARAHREVFAEVRPAAAMVAVAALIDPRLLVEIEAVALAPGDRRYRAGTGDGVRPGRGRRRGRGSRGCGSCPSTIAAATAVGIRPSRPS